MTTLAAENPGLRSTSGTATGLRSLGLVLVVFAAVAFSGPGRIDIADGQARYEVARSLVDHGDLAVRNPDVWFGVLPGRGGKSFTSYRLPQSVLGVPAILAADATGARSEPRRHFFFVLTSAAAAALLAWAYIVAFRRRGFSDRAALAWAAAGIFCTPSWYYATSTFDDILGTAAIVGAVVCAGTAVRQKSLVALATGLLVGVAFNCKQPLLLLGLIAFVELDDATAPWRRRLAILATAGLGLAACVAVYYGYEGYKFPAELRPLHAVLLRRYGPVWSSTPIIGLLVLALSPAASVVLYSPTVLLCVHGIRQSPRRWVARATVIAVAGFVAFISALAFFKGDPSWGPRYLTPVFGLLWLGAPAAAARTPRVVTTVLLALGLTVQLGALAVDPHRLYIEHGLPSAFGVLEPRLYFKPAYAHLLNRPREIREVWQHRHQPGATFSPVAPATRAFPIIDEVERGPAAIAKLKLLDSFRPWWLAQRYLPREQRPVDLGWAAVVLGALLMGGLALLGLAERRARPSTSITS